MPKLDQAGASLRAPGSAHCGLHVRFADAASLEVMERIGAEISRADGLLFDCPLCGRHSVLCWGRSVHPDIKPNPGRWEITGTSLADVTLSPSVNLNVGPEAVCKWHGWVKNGDAT